MCCDLTNVTVSADLRKRSEKEVLRLGDLIIYSILVVSAASFRMSSQATRLSHWCFFPREEYCRTYSWQSCLQSSFDQWLAMYCTRSAAHD